MSPAKRAELIKIGFGTRVAPRKPLLNGVNFTTGRGHYWGCPAL